MPRITQFPIQLNYQNSVQLTDSIGAELDLLLLETVNSRTFDRTYGVDTSYLQQASSDPQRYIPVFSLELREKLHKFTKNISLNSARIFRKPDRKRTIYIEVFWQETVTENSKVFEITT